MEPEPSDTKRAPRKVRFQPKAPRKTEQKLVLPKAEKYENDAESTVAEQLLQKLNDSKSRPPKYERKTGPSQVAFGHGGSSSSTSRIRSYGVGKTNMNQGSSSNGGAEHGIEKEYKEPWDYYTNYPVTLPMRRPYSGNPELLDEEEFEGDHEGDYDENAINSAAELGLLEDNPENNLFFVHLPKVLPVMTEIKDNDNDKKTTKRLTKVEELQSGFLGKLLVYRSGAVKLKVGDTLYDVSPGLSGSFAQDAVAVNTKERHACNLGEISKRAVVTPDIDSILDTTSDLCLNDS